MAAAALLLLGAPGAVRGQTLADTTAIGAPVDSLSVPAFPETLSIAPVARERPDTTSVRGPRPFLVLLRSAVVPGWGQATNRKFWKAGIFLVARSALTVAAIHEDRESSRWSRRASEAATAEEAALAFARAEDHASRRDARIWYHAAVALYSMADAYVDAHLRDFEERFEISLAPQDGGLALAVSHRFR